MHPPGLLRPLCLGYVDMPLCRGLRSRRADADEDYDDDEEGGEPGPGPRGRPPKAPGAQRRGGAAIAAAAGVRRSGRRAGGDAHVDVDDGLGAELEGDECGGDIWAVGVGGGGWVRCSGGVPQEGEEEGVGWLPAWSWGSLGGCWWWWRGVSNGDVVPRGVFIVTATATTQWPSCLAFVVGCGGCWVGCLAATSSGLACMVRV